MNKKYKNDNYVKKERKDIKKELALKFIENIEKEGILKWKKGWTISNKAGFPKNATTNISYNGINKFSLMYANLCYGYKDNRWATFKQIQNKGWKLKENSKGKGVPIEYYLVYHKDTNTPIPMSEYNALPPSKQEDYRFVSKTSFVFNGDIIDGLEQIIIEEKEKIILGSELISDLATTMNVKIQHLEGFDAPSYSPSKDLICLPSKNEFKSEYEYNATALHELSHSTGHCSRLDRDLTGRFGSKSYAKEELIAEISSAFMSVNIEMDFDKIDIDNTTAYLQSWLSCLKNDHSILIDAIKQAEEVNEYMEQCLELVVQLEKEEEYEL